MPLSVSVLFSPSISLRNAKHIYINNKTLNNRSIHGHESFPSIIFTNQLDFQNFRQFSPRILSEINCGLHFLIWTL